MSNPAEQTSNPEKHPSQEQAPDSQPIVDVRDLVYTSSYSEEGGSISDDPREIINNPAVAPEMLDTTPENLRDDMFNTPPAG